MEQIEQMLGKRERTEEVQDIIERMPTGFSVKITFFVLSIVILFFLLGWIIKYPDVVTGVITINATKASVKLVANTSGKLTLIAENHQVVSDGDYIGVINNAASFNDVQLIAKLLKKISFKNVTTMHDVINSFPRELELGEINVHYFTFLSSLSQVTQYYQGNLLDERVEVLKELIKEYEDIVQLSKNRLEIGKENLRLVEKFHDRDSVLLSKNVVSEAESDRTQISLISAYDSYQTLFKDVSVANSQLHQTKNELKQVELQKIDKEKELELGLLSSYNELDNQIRIWEHKYVLRAPMSGTVQFSQFWNNNDFVQNGEGVFSVVPINEDIVGQMNLPVAGAGKVKEGQEVIIKLVDYPYIEFGSIKGIVSDISLVTSIQTSQEGVLENYLLNVTLPEKLKTNFGSELDFRFEIKGTGDIIVHKRRLIERLFDNLTYKIKQ